MHKIEQIRVKWMCAWIIGFVANIMIYEAFQKSKGKIQIFIFHQITVNKRKCNPFKQSSAVLVRVRIVKSWWRRKKILKNAFLHSHRMSCSIFTARASLFAARRFAKKRRTHILLTATASAVSVSSISTVLGHLFVLLLLFLFSLHSTLVTYATR